MSHSTLFLRSLAIIAILTGFAHLFAYTSQENPTEQVKEEIETPMAKVGMDSNPNQAHEVQSPLLEKEETESINYDPDTDYIVGKWKVSYEIEEFTGSIIYDIKKEGEVFQAYTYQYEDQNGYAEKAEGAKTLTINEFDGYTGKGTYMLAYEGKSYDVSCQIDRVDVNTFTLSYDYYGFADIETWKRF